MQKTFTFLLGMGLMLSLAAAPGCGSSKRAPTEVTVLDLDSQTFVEPGGEAQVTPPFNEKAATAEIPNGAGLKATLMNDGAKVVLSADKNAKKGGPYKLTITTPSGKKCNYPIVVGAATTSKKARR